MIPSPWELVLLGLSVFWTWKLLSDQKILDGPREWLVARFPAKRRDGFVDFLHCPWCFGFWITLGWWGAWQLFPHPTLVLAGLISVATAAALTAHFTE